MKFLFLVILVAIEVKAMLPLSLRTKTSPDRPQCPKHSVKYYNRLDEKNAIFGCLDKSTKEFIGPFQVMKIFQDPQHGTQVKVVNTISNLNIAIEDKLNSCISSLENVNATLMAHATNQTPLSRDKARTLNSAIQDILQIKTSTLLK
jgi:hypothetical protein